MITIQPYIKTIICDLDGTLYDKSGLAMRMTRRLWWCLPLLVAERLARRNMHYWHFASEEEFFSAFYANMARGHWWTPNMAQQWYQRIFLPTMVKLIAKYHHPREEVVSMLQENRKRGVKIAIYSDYGCVEEKLEALRIDPSQFDLLIAAPSLGALKPSAVCVRQLMEMLGANPQTTLFVGDRDEKDGESARMVGAEFLLVK